MRARPNPAASIGILSLLGLLAAFLSFFIPPLLTAPRSPLFLGSSLGIFPGDVFGALIAFYFWAYAGIRSMAKAIGLVVTSAFAYVVSIYSGAFLGVYLSAALGIRFDNSKSEGLTTGMIAPLAIAGVIGAFLILIAVLRMYSAERSWRSVLLEALPWSLPGGLFALAGARLGPSLGRAVWLAVQSHQLMPVDPSMQYALEPGTMTESSVHIVWQAGMGIVVGIMFSRTQLAPAAPDNAIPERKLRPSNAILFVLMCLFLAWFAIGTKRLETEYQAMRWRRAHYKEFSAAPPPSYIPK